MTPCQKLLKQEGTARRIESTLPQPPKTKDVGRGLRKIVACSQSSSQCLLVSTVFGTVSSPHPTSFLHLLYMCSYVYSCTHIGGSTASKSSDDVHVVLWHIHPQSHGVQHVLHQFLILFPHTPVTGVHRYSVSHHHWSVGHTTDRGSFRKILSNIM